MAVQFKAKAEWKGSKEGGGDVEFGTFSGLHLCLALRDGNGTNPEQLIAAAHASCYSMQLSGLLTAGDHPPTSIQTSAVVTIEAGVGTPASRWRPRALCPASRSAVCREAAKARRTARSPRRLRR